MTVRTLPPSAVDKLAADARLLAFQFKPGQLLGGFVVHDQKQVAAINAANQERAEAYARWRSTGWLAGEISSL